jgi:hypothetical protein
MKLLEVYMINMNSLDRSVLGCLFLNAFHLDRIRAPAKLSDTDH